MRLPSRRRMLSDGVGCAPQKQKPGTEGSQHALPGNAGFVHARSSRIKKAFSNKILARVVGIAKEPLDG